MEGRDSKDDLIGKARFLLLYTVYHNQHIAGFDLITLDSYFMTLLVEVFTNHSLVENIFHESYI